MGKARFDFSEHRFMIISNGDRQSAISADYLFQQMDRRNMDKQDLELLRSDANSSSFGGSIIYVELVPDLEPDYRIVNEKGRLSIFGKDTATLRWLSYQLIELMAGVHDMVADDLPPCYVNFDTGEFRFAFDP
jgi:hypothetical protein